MSPATILILTVSVLVAGCSSELFPSRVLAQKYFNDNEDSMTSLAGLLEAEETFDKLWCHPNGVVAEASARSEEFELSGAKLDAYFPLCEKLRIVGAWLEPYGTNIHLDITSDKLHLYRIDFVRASADALLASPCDLSAYLRSSSSCDIDLGNSWSIRYRWVSEDKPELLFK